MKEKHTLVNVKKYLKELATSIRIAKQLRKTVYCNLSPFSEEDINKVKNARWGVSYYSAEFRHHHIAYCEFRGRTREQIEPKCEFSPNEDVIHIIKGQIKRDMEAHYAEKQSALCAGA